MATNELRNMAQSDNTSSDNSENVKKVTVIATFRVDENKAIIEKLKDSLICESFRGLKIMPNDEELYINDHEYKKLCSDYKKARIKKEEYLKLKQ